MRASLLYPCLIGLASVAGCPREPYVLPPPDECPQESPVIGVEGGFGVDTFELEWVDYHEASVTGTAAPIYVRIPDDIVSYAITVDSGTRWTALGVVSLDDAPIIDINAVDGPTSYNADPFWHAWSPTVTLVQPTTRDTVPSPGCLTVVALSDGDAAGDGASLSIVSRRGDGDGTVDVNVVVVSGVSVDQAGLERAIARMGAVLDGAGVTLGDVVYYEVEGETFVSAESDDELASLRAASIPGPEQAVNLFVIQDFTEADGTLGFAAGIPGPIGLPGTGGSGVVLSVDAHLDGDFAFDPSLFGETAAHEIGHQLGLFHTTEAEGTSHDPLPDTPECDADSFDTNGDGEVDAEECDGHGGRNVMFWTSASFSQEVWSADQGFVLTRSPALR